MLAVQDNTNFTTQHRILFLNKTEEVNFESY